MSHRTRGSALVVTMIALAVLMVLVAGAIAFTGQNREAAAIKSGGDRVLACSSVARQYLLSRLQLYGIAITSLTPLDERIPDDPDTTQQTRVMQAHYDAVDAGTTIVAVTASAFSEASGGIREAANTITRSGSLGQYYKVTAKCRDATGREAETEFLFRYGL